MVARKTVLTILGSQREAIQLAPVVAALRRTPGIDARVCITTSSVPLAPLLDLFGLQPDCSVDLAEAGVPGESASPAQLRIMGEVMDSERPARVLIGGDTSSTLVGALAAYFRRIPVSHIEAARDPGSPQHQRAHAVHRRIISTIANQHLVVSEDAAAALVREGIDVATIDITGNTAIDTLLAARAHLAGKPDATPGLDLLFSRFRQRHIVLASAAGNHTLAAMATLVDAVDAIARLPDVAVIFPVGLRAPAAVLIERKLKGRENIAMIPPQDYAHSVRLLEASALVITNDAAKAQEIRELGKPVLSICDTGGCLALVDGSAVHIALAARKLLALNNSDTKPAAGGSAARRAATRVSLIVSETNLIHWNASQIEHLISAKEVALRSVAG